VVPSAVISAGGSAEKEGKVSASPGKRRTKR
jgi:hypothetical protein